MRNTGIHIKWALGVRHRTGPYQGHPRNSIRQLREGNAIYYQITDNAQPEIGPMFMEQARSMLGTGIFNSDGDMWKFHRTITRPFFIRERISDFEIFCVHTDDALRQAKMRLREGYPIDFRVRSS